jgi:hypothetical protein
VQRGIWSNKKGALITTHCEPLLSNYLIIFMEERQPMPLENIIKVTQSVFLNVSKKTRFAILNLYYSCSL